MADTGAKITSLVPYDREFLIELARARRACTPAERKWLRVMSEQQLTPYQAGKLLGVSSRTTMERQRRDRVRLVMELEGRLVEHELGITRGYVLKRLQMLVDSNLPNYYEDGTFKLKMPHEWSREDAFCVEEMSFDANGNPKLKLCGKKEPLLALARYKALFAAERIEITGKDGMPIGYAEQITDALDRTEDPNVAAELYSELIKGPVKDD